MLLIKQPELAFLPLIFPDTHYGSNGNGLLSNTSEFSSSEHFLSNETSKDFTDIAETENTSPSNLTCNLVETENQVNEIIEKAKLEAEKIISQTHKQAKEIEKKTYEQALNQARTEANAELTKTIEIINKELGKSLEELTVLRQEIAAHMEQELLKLSIEVAKKVVHREITTDREVIVSLVQVSLARLHNRTVASVRLNPIDYQYLVANSDRITLGKTIELASDPTVTRGGCVIETDFGSIDARIEQQFAEIERSLL